MHHIQYTTARVEIIVHDSAKKDKNWQHAEDKPLLLSMIDLRNNLPTESVTRYFYLDSKQSSHAFVFTPHINIFSSFVLRYELYMTGQSLHTSCSKADILLLNFMMGNFGDVL